MGPRLNDPGTRRASRATEDGVAHVSHRLRGRTRRNGPERLPFEVVIRPRRPLARRPIAALLAAIVVAMAVVGGAAPAWAHAELTTSEPADNEIVAAAPNAITLRFSEPIETALGAVRLFDATGEPVAVGDSQRVEGDRDAVQVSLPALGRGTYLAAWRVTSADGHPIQGSYLFSVGERSAVSAGAAAVLARSTGDRTVGVLLGASRWLVFGGFVLLVGALAFVADTRRLAPRTLAITGIGAAVLMAASLASLALQGPYATGASLSRAWQPSVWADTMHTSFGRQALFRTALAAFGAALALVASKVDRAWWRTAALSIGPLVAATIAYSGHGHTGRYPLLGIITDITHLVAIAWWLGGLTVLAATAVRSADGREVFQRFSPLAFGAVVVIIVSGLVQSWRQVGSLDALATDYGRLLQVKLAAVVALIVVAALTRRSLQRWSADLRPPALLRRAVLGELTLGLVVMGVTAGLVATPPARESVARPVNVTMVDKTGATLNVTIDPARVGAAVSHLYATPPGGSLIKAEEATMNLALPSKGVDDLAVALEAAGPNHFSSTGLRFPFAGRWQVTVTVRFGEFDASTFTTTVSVR